MSEKSNQDDLQQQDAEPSSKWEKFAKNKASEAEVEQVEVADQVSSAEAGDVAETNWVAKVEQLEKDLAAAQEQSKQAVADALRHQADALNADRRAQKQVSQARLFANEKLVGELLPVLDSMTRAQEGVSTEDPQVQSMLEVSNLTQ